KRSGWCIELRGVHVEGGVSAENHIELLVPSGAPTTLRVLLDQALTAIGGVRVDTESGDPKRASHRQPVDAGDVNRLQLIEMGHASHRCHRTVSQPSKQIPCDARTTSTRSPEVNPTVWRSQLNAS